MSSARSTRPSPCWVLVPTAFLFTAYVVIATSAADLFAGIVCRSNGYNDSELCDRDAEALSDAILGLEFVSILSLTLFSWVSTSWVASLSDRYGRTRILVLGVTGGLIAHLCTILAYLFASTQAPDIYLLVLGGVVLQGGVGGLVGINAVTLAYLTDTTTEATRASTLSVYQGLLYLSVLLGTTLGKSKLVHRDLLRTHCILAGISATYAIYLYVIPDSLTNEEKLQRQATYRSNIRDNQTGPPLKRTKRIASQCNPLATFAPTTNITAATFRQIGGRNWSLAILLVGFLLSSFASCMYVSTVNKSLSGPWTSPPAEGNPYCQGALVFAFLAYFPTLKWAVTPKRTALSTSVSKEDKPNSVAQDFKIGCISIVALLASHIFLALFPNSLPWAAPVLIGLLGVVFQPALMNVIVSTYERQGGEHTGRFLGNLTVMEEISYVFAIGLFVLLDNSPALAIIPAAILAALYFGYCHVRMPDIYPDTTEHDLDEEERLLGDN